jgi:hypothetical protein
MNAHQMKRRGRRLLFLSYFAAFVTRFVDTAFPSAKS